MSSSFDFRALHQWAESVQPVFIVGPERSGTSMMFRTIVSHDAFCSFTNATVETFCFIRPFQLFESASAANYEMRVYLGKQYEAFMRATEPIRQINLVCDQSDLPRSYLSNQRQMIWNRRNYRDLLRAFFYFSWLNLGQKRLAEKTPAHVRCMAEIIDCFPRAKLLVCVRDPVEVIASHRKRLAREIELGKKADDPSLGWLSKSTEHYLGYFEHVNRLVGNAQKSFPQALLRVPYRRATTSSQFLREIFDFIGESVDGLQASKNVPTDKALDWDPLLASLPKENVIDWKLWMTREEFDLVQRTAENTPLGDWAAS